MKSCDTYKEIKKMEYDNMVVRVHIPDLSHEERERRLEAIRKAAAKLLQ